MNIIVIPFVENESKANEIIYALRSLDQHVKDDFKVVIVGDLPKNVVGVTHIDCRPIGSRLVDSIEKIKTVFAYPEFEEVNKITRMYDDVVLLSDVDSLEDLPNFHFGLYSEDSFTGSGHWWDMKARTFAFLRENKVSKCFDGQTHLPITFEKEKFLELAPEAMQNELLLESVYVSLQEEKEHKTGDGDAAYFYGYENKRSKPSQKIEDIEKHCENATFINFNDEGLTPALQEFLKKKFPKPCRFEKGFKKKPNTGEKSGV